MLSMKRRLIGKEIIGDEMMVDGDEGDVFGGRNDGKGRLFFEKGWFEDCEVKGEEIGKGYKEVLVDSFIGIGLI